MVDGEPVHHQDPDTISIVEVQDSTVSYIQNILLPYMYITNNKFQKARLCFASSSYSNDLNSYINVVFSYQIFK